MKILVACRDSKSWNTCGIEGVHRFVARTWRLIVGAPLPTGLYKDGTVVTNDEPTVEQLKSLHRCIAKVSFLLESDEFMWLKQFEIQCFSWQISLLGFLH